MALFGCLYDVIGLHNDVRYLWEWNNMLLGRGVLTRAICATKFRERVLQRGAVP